MSKHTPGPRQVRRLDDTRVVVLGPDRDGQRELIGTFTGGHREEDALLDAAAPALLAACEAMLKYLSPRFETYSQLLCAIAETMGPIYRCPECQDEEEDDERRTTRYAGI